ncbi:MAG: ParA family protein [Canibacter sp.]
MHVISVSSLKGGVGKTTVALGLASASFSRGLRTLVVDLDPQSDVSTGLDVSAGEQTNISDVLADPKRIRDAIVSSGWNQHHEGHIDLLLGSPSAINFDGPHPSAREIWRLEEALSEVEKDYDLVIIDCAPSLNALTRTAWAASDRVLVVTEPGLFAVAAADRALRAIDELRRGVSPRLEPLGIVINRARLKSAEHQFRIRELREMFGSLVVEPLLPERTSIQQAQGAAKPLHIWPGEATQEMASHFDELLDLAIASLGIATPRAPQAPPKLVSTDPVDDISDTESVVTDRVDPTKSAE